MLQKDGKDNINFLNVLDILRQDYLCPISRQVMKDPVIDCEGISYEKEHIEKWLQSNNFSPVTGNMLPEKNLIPNYYFQDLINRIEVLVPTLCSQIQVLKDQLDSIKLQNMRLKKQNQLSSVSENEQNQEKNGVEILYKENSSYFLKNNKNANKQFIKVQDQKDLKINKISQGFKNSFADKNRRIIQIEEDKEQNEHQISKNQKLSKRKIIQKLKFQSHFDLSMQKLLKKSKKDWADHLNNVNIQYAQAASKNQQQLLLKEQSIKRFSQTIKTKQTKISELNKMVEETQHPQLKIFQKLQDLSSQFKNIIAKKAFVQPKKSGVEQIQLLKTQNQKLKIQLTHSQNQKKQISAQQNQISSLTVNPIVQKYQSELKSIKSQFESYKLKKSKQIEKLSLSQNKLAQKYQKLVLKLQANNQQLKNKVKDLTSQNRKNQTIKFSKQVKKFQNQKQNLLRLLQEAHQNYDRNSYKSSSQINQYKAEIKQQLNTIAINHQKWMFIFFNIFWALNYCAKDLSENSDEILPIDNFLNESIHQGLIQKQPSALKMKKDHQKLAANDKKQQTNKINVAQSYQMADQLSFPIKRREKREIPKFPEVMEYIFSQIGLHMQHSYLDIEKRVKMHGMLYRNSPYLSVELYRKLEFIYQALHDKTTWNFWNAYKVYLNEKHESYSGFEISGSILLTIINLKQAGLVWQELVSISAENQNIDNEAWKKLIKNSHMYQNLRFINLKNTLISEVTLKDLQSWKNLKQIHFSHKLLSEKSLVQIEKFMKKNSNGTVIYYKNEQKQHCANM